MNLRNLHNLVSWKDKKPETVNVAPKTAERIVIVNAVGPDTVGMGIAAVVGIGVIAAAGVGIGILFAPKSGRETQRDLKNTALNTVESIMDKVRKKSKSVKDSAAHATQETVSDVIKDVHRKTESIKKDVQDGFLEIAQDIHEIGETILID